MKTTFRSLFLAATVAATLGLPGRSSADDKIFFRNDSPRPAHVVVMDDRGRFRGAERVHPGEFARLLNGKGKTLVSVNGQTFRVRDIGHEWKDDSWLITWGNGFGGPPPPPLHKAPFLKHNRW